MMAHLHKSPRLTEMLRVLESPPLKGAGSRETCGGCHVAHPAQVDVVDGATKFLVQRAFATTSTTHLSAGNIPLNPPTAKAAAFEGPTKGDFKSAARLVVRGYCS